MIAVRPLREDEREWVRRVIRDRWGSETAVAHGVAYEPASLAGFVAEDEGGARVGLLTYHVEGGACEIVTIDAFEEGKGVGTALIEAAVALGHRRVWLITTNDNVRAQRFYEHLGFRLAAVHEGAVARSRELKPEIPLADEHGTPIRDELEYELADRVSAGLDSLGGSEPKEDAMAPRADLGIVSLGVQDLARAASFFEALGWERTNSSNDEIVWFRTPHSYLGLFGYEALAEDANLPADPKPAFGGVTLAINAASQADVDAFYERAIEAGARVLKRPTKAEWGGYSGYFADPDGYPWEVAHAPGFPIAEDGRLHID